MSTPLKKKVEHIAQNLYRNCVVPAGDLLSRTGRVSPKSTLRFSQAQEAFAWCWDIHERRYFTKSAVEGALKCLVDKYPVEVPVSSVPGFSEYDWLRTQTKQVQHLCKRAVRNSSAWNRSSSSSSLAMADAEETQAWDLEARSLARRNLHAAILYKNYHSMNCAGRLG